MNRLVAVILALICGCGAFFFAMQKGFVNPYPVVCDLVAEKIFLEPTIVNKWKRTCLRRSRLVTPYSGRSLIIKDLNNVLGLLNVSHLEVYDSADVQNIWTGENKETGIESEFVDSELVVFKIHPKSPSSLAGMQVGDIIKSINGEQPNPWEAQSEPGSYAVERLGEKLKFHISTATIKRDEDFSITKYADGNAVLKIPSFRSEFFKDEKIAILQKELQGFRHLIIDLRGNAGGNFVAGLRFLSQMICQPSEVGQLVRPRSPEKNSTVMPDQLDDEKQLELFNSYKTVRLKTFKSSFCYTGHLKVLVDSKTASVAEMVAQALKEFRQAPLWGAPSRGQLLVGVWYSVNEIGPGVEMSIPEGVYISRKGYTIEGRGVGLDRVLYYNISEMQLGIDSWVKKALD